MASGHVNRTNRPNTWLHRPASDVKIFLANSEPSTHGTSETSTDVRYTAAFGGNADNQPGIAGQSRFMSTRPSDRLSAPTDTPVSRK